MLSSLGAMVTEIESSRDVSPTRNETLTFLEESKIAADEKQTDRWKDREWACSVALPDKSNTVLQYQVHSTSSTYIFPSIFDTYLDKAYN